jgi:hypothetical protein
MVQHKSRHILGSSQSRRPRNDQRIGSGGHRKTGSAVLPLRKRENVQEAAPGPANGRSGGLVEFHLTPGQEQLLVPLIRNAVSAGSNLLFLATATPRDGAWLLQATTVTAATGSKISRLPAAGRLGAHTPNFALPASQLSAKRPGGPFRRQPPL